MSEFEHRSIARDADDSLNDDSPVVEVSLADDAVDFTLQEVTEHAFGRATNESDARLVELLLAAGFERTLVVDLLVNDLRMESQVQRVLHELHFTVDDLAVFLENNPRERLYGLFAGVVAPFAQSQRFRMLGEARQTPTAHEGYEPISARGVGAFYDARHASSGPAVPPSASRAERSCAESLHDLESRSQGAAAEPELIYTGRVRPRGAIGGGDGGGSRPPAERTTDVRNASNALVESCEATQPWTGEVARRLMNRAEARGEETYPLVVSVTSSPPYIRQHIAVRRALSILNTQGSAVTVLEAWETALREELIFVSAANVSAASGGGVPSGLQLLGSSAEAAAVDVPAPVPALPAPIPALQTQLVANRQLQQMIEAQCSATTHQMQQTSAALHALQAANPSAFAQYAAAVAAQSSSVSPYALTQGVASQTPFASGVGPAEPPMRRCSFAAAADDPGSSTGFPPRLASGLNSGGSGGSGGGGGGPPGGGSGGSGGDGGGGGGPPPPPSGGGVGGTAGGVGVAGVASGVGTAGPPVHGPGVAAGAATPASGIAVASAIGAPVAATCLGAPVAPPVDPTVALSAPIGPTDAAVAARLLLLGWDYAAFLTAPVVWFDSGLAADVAHVGVRLPPRTRLEIVRSAATRESMARVRQIRTRTSPLVPEDLAICLGSQADSVASRNTVYAVSWGEMLDQLMQGYVFRLTEMDPADEAAHYVLQAFYRAVCLVQSYSDLFSRFNTTVCDRLGHDGIMEIRDALDHECLPESNEDVNDAFNKVVWKVGERASALCLRVQKLGSHIQKNPEQMLARIKSAMRNARDDDDGRKPGDQEFVGTVVDAFANRTSVHTSLRALMLALDDHRVARKPLPPRTRGLGSGGGISQALVSPPVAPPPPPAVPLTAPVPSPAPVPTPSLPSAVAPPPVTPAAPSATDSDSMLAQHMARAGLGGGGKLEIPRGPLMYDKIIASNKVERFKGLTPSPLWNPAREDGKFGLACWLCSENEKAAVDEMTNEQFRHDHGEPGASTTELMRLHLIVHHPPYCRCFRREVALHVRKCAADAWMLQADPDFNAKLLAAKAHALAQAPA